MAKIKLIYDSYATWEKDYIPELFSIINYDFVALETILYDDPIIINNNILVFSSSAHTYNEIINIVIKIKPKIIVNLSDEFGNRHEYTNLAHYTNLLLQQYHFNSYCCNKYSNIMQIPLGYMTNMFSRKPAFSYISKPISERKYIWSFAGAVKQDRQELIDKFSNEFDKFWVGNNISPQTMLDIYSDSIFIPNGKGYNVIDCFRIYEAILSGCIPIIVCSDEEFNERFYYNNDLPPFIYEKTWDLAVAKCRYLLNNPCELESVAKLSYIWLENKIKILQKAIYTSCN